MSDSTDPTIEPVTRRDHDAFWSANLERPHHAADRDLVIEQAAFAGFNSSTSTSVAVAGT